VLTHQDLDDRHPEERVRGLAAAETHAWTFRSEETHERAYVLFNPTIEFTKPVASLSTEGNGATSRLVV
jgi:hypothetical protein